MITTYRPTRMGTGYSPIAFTNEAEAQRYIDQEVVDPKNWQIQHDLIFESIAERNEFVEYTPEQLEHRQTSLDMLKDPRSTGEPTTEIGMAW